jgi:hypothetical protein
MVTITWFSYCFRETQLFSLMFLKNTKVCTKMFIRWGRSNVMKNIAMAKYVLQIQVGSKFGTRLLFVNQFYHFNLSKFQLLCCSHIIVHPLLFVSSTLLKNFLPVFQWSFMQKNMVQMEFFGPCQHLYTFGLFWHADCANSVINKRVIKK